MHTHPFPHIKHSGQRTLKGLQFAVGMIVALGGAGFIVGKLLRQLF